MNNNMRQVRALLKDSQYDAAIAEARAARDAHKDDRSVREVITPFVAHALCNVIAPCTAAADRLQSPCCHSMVWVCGLHSIKFCLGLRRSCTRRKEQRS